jgi:hypothetical protein
VEGGRLQALAAQLGESPAYVARTLHDELERAFAELDGGIASGDADAVTRATHAARNSVFMLDDAPMLGGLRALDAAVGRGDAAATRSARGELALLWTRLSAVLSAAG